MRRHRRSTTAVTVVIVAAVVAAAYFMGRSDEAGRPFLLASPAQAAESPSISSVGVVDPRDVYYPGSEALETDEMRIIALRNRASHGPPKTGSLMLARRAGQRRTTSQKWLSS